MTTTIQLQREVEKIRQKVQLKPEDMIVVRMWWPGNKDPEYKGGPIRIKAFTEEDIKALKEKKPLPPLKKV